MSLSITATLTCDGCGETVTKPWFDDKGWTSFTGFKQWLSLNKWSDPLGRRTVDYYCPACTAKRIDSAKPCAKVGE